MNALEIPIPERNGCGVLVDLWNPALRHDRRDG
jgi:hypothetical protein